MATQDKPTFVYTWEMLDSDAANARSAAYRTVRDAAGLPEEEDGGLNDDAKSLHAAAGLAARNAASVVFKGMTAKKSRAEWTPDQASKVHELMAQEGTKAYRLTLSGAGFKTDDKVEKDAMEAFKRRLVERRALAEVAWRTSTGMGLDDAAKSIFG